MAFTIQRLTHSASHCAPHFRVIFTPDTTALPTCQFLSRFLNGWFVKPCSPQHSEDLLRSELARCLSCQFALCSQTCRRESNSHTQSVDSASWVSYWSNSETYGLYYWFVTCKNKSWYYFMKLFHVTVLHVFPGKHDLHILPNLHLKG